VGYSSSDAGAHDHDPNSGPAPEGIQEPTDPRYPVGDTVILNADHMPGVDGAKATIDSSADETVYMVDFEMDGIEMTNHKWVVESELQPVSYATTISSGCILWPPSLGDGGRASVVGLRMSHSSLRTASDSRGPEPLLVHLAVVCVGLKTELLRVAIEMLRGIVAEHCLCVVRLMRERPGVGDCIVPL